MKNGDFHSFHSFQIAMLVYHKGVSSSPSSLAIPIRVVEADEFEVVIFRAAGAKQLLLKGMGRTAWELWGSTIFWHLRVRISLLAFFLEDSGRLTESNS
jgi:hypothetical protein